VFDIYISGLIYDGGARTENVNTGKFPTCCCCQGLAIYIGKLKGTVARDFSLKSLESVNRECDTGKFPTCYRRQGLAIYRETKT
jgi:hypothetical protein